MSCSLKGTQPAFLSFMGMITVLHFFERGDADTSGSTVRTALVIPIVIAVLTFFAVALLALMDRITPLISSVAP